MIRKNLPLRFSLLPGDKFQSDKLTLYNGGDIHPKEDFSIGHTPLNPYVESQS